MTEPFSSSDRTSRNRGSGAALFTNRNNDCTVWETEELHLRDAIVPFTTPCRTYNIEL